MAISIKYGWDYSSFKDENPTSKLLLWIRWDSRKLPFLRKSHLGAGFYHKVGK